MQGSAREKKSEYLYVFDVKFYLTLLRLFYRWDGRISIICAFSSFIKWERLAMNFKIRLILFKKKKKEIRHMLSFPFVVCVQFQFFVFFRRLICILRTRMNKITDNVWQIIMECGRVVAFICRQNCCYNRIEWWGGRRAEQNPLHKIKMTIAYHKLPTDTRRACCSWRVEIVQKHWKGVVGPLCATHQQ